MSFNELTEGQIFEWIRTAEISELRKVHNPRIGILDFIWSEGLKKPDELKLLEKIIRDNSDTFYVLINEIEERPELIQELKKYKDQFIIPVKLKEIGIFNEYLKQEGLNIKAVNKETYQLYLSSQYMTK